MAAVAEAAFEHEVDRVIGFGLRSRDDHALAGGQAVGLDDHRMPQRVGKGLGGRRLAETLVRGGGNAGLDAQVFHEALGAFQHGGSF